ncbi:Regulatory protein CAT8 [Cyberlindnera fabianii]|uniref:Regulatory protein CAT8 n=1 Tax=Cyberlindnera fabianii TaxID=36022 RepID=A0A1V2LC99_CYBFA|nr:Regulatory protein CAT8 [Cyberlindnera fabianii]
MADEICENKQPKTKVIRTPGSQTERVAQACDRCRLKKTRCDGKRPQCSQCAAVGFECKVSDRLSRRAFPRGYTETLEERVRELEAENRRLLALLEMKDERAELLSKIPAEPLSSSNLAVLDKLNNSNENTTDDGHNHVHSGPGCCANYPHSVHERPVSIAGSVDLDHGDLTDDDSMSFAGGDSIYGGSAYGGMTSMYNEELPPQRSMAVSFEQSNAPGLSAAAALARLKSAKLLGNANGLANLVAMSVPRSTEETLFVPSLLSKIGEVHGFDSSACLATAYTIASLKEAPKPSATIAPSAVSIASIDFRKITPPESQLFFSSLSLPPKIQLDQLVTVFFQCWAPVLPILDQGTFLTQYQNLSKSAESRFIDNAMLGKERFGAILVLVIQLALLAQPEANHANGDGKRDLELIAKLDTLIRQLVGSSLASASSIQSLQVLSLAMLYALHTGDVASSYSLRGRVVTMAQQLRLHRCPSAVLGTSGSTVSKAQQGERRVLFWCIYTLDAFSSLQLGVPRLFKDTEIECALPTGDDTDGPEGVNIVLVNNNKVSLVGKVSNLSLAMMRYSTVLGSILDFVFQRHPSMSTESSTTNLLQKQTLVHEGLLDDWRRDLPQSLKFELDVNGLPHKNSLQANPQHPLLILSYYTSKLLIHLPVIASEIGKRMAGNTTSGSPSHIVVQQCAIAILSVLTSLSHVPVPLNIPRTKTRLTLLSAKGALDYTRGGALFQESKNILQASVTELREQNSGDVPGSLSKHCVDWLEKAIDAILAQPDSLKRSSSEKKRSASLSTKGSLKRSPLQNESRNGDELEQMLSQLTGPPIVPTDSAAQKRAAAATCRHRSSSFSHTTPPDNVINANGGTVNGYPQIPTAISGQYKVAPSVSSDISLDENIELDFAADGSLALAPWLDFDIDIQELGKYSDELTQSTGHVKLEGANSAPNVLEVPQFSQTFDFKGGMNNGVSATSASASAGPGPGPSPGDEQKRRQSLFDWQNSM